MCQLGGVGGASGYSLSHVSVYSRASRQLLSGECSHISTFVSPLSLFISIYYYYIHFSVYLLSLKGVLFGFWIFKKNNS